MVKSVPVLNIATFLWPGLGDLRPAFVAYAVAIGTMLWRAAARIGHRGAPTRGEWAALAGRSSFARAE